ncbi:hypothetical protein PAL_GLEAN10001852 [Pteropus alecto]|uniref:Uncharacterized protein n=1 Tax=Pteropus alecto TaxID=9402 RepID=L5L842_PTEAL|nr:hypothetical protein PAL_GLEAN10001852 [Pteropus alecto]
MCASRAQKRATQRSKQTTDNGAAFQNERNMRFREQESKNTVSSIRVPSKITALPRSRKIRPRKNTSGDVDPEMTARTESPDEESQNGRHDLFFEENTPVMRKTEDTERSGEAAAWAPRGARLP